jgi:hypothetical protein
LQSTFLKIKKTQALSLFLITLLSLTCLMEKVFASGVLSERNYRKLEAIHQLLNKDQLTQAQQKLEIMLVRKNPPYTQALFLQTAAHISIKQDKYPTAIKQLNEVLALKILPDFVEKNIEYNLAQLYAGEQDYKNSLTILKRWLKNNKKISPNNHVFIAMIYSHEHFYNDAISHILQAIKQSKKPAESWYQILISFHLQQKHYQKAILVYHILLKNYSHQLTYWKQLSGLYLQIKKPAKALAAYQSADHLFLLKKESDLQRLVDLYLYLNLPFQAAEKLHQSIQSKTITSNQKNWKKLADCWILAKEYPLAIKALKQASHHDKTGKIELKIARLFIENSQWKQALISIDKALLTGKLTSKEQNKSYFLKGISAYYAKQPEIARQAFIKTKNYPQTRQWLKQLEFK